MAVGLTVGQGPALSHSNLWAVVSNPARADLLCGSIFSVSWTVLAGSEPSLFRRRRIYQDPSLES